MRLIDTDFPTRLSDSLISRADAIETVLTYFIPRSHTGERGEYEEDFVRTIFKSLPSAEAVQGEWIEYTDCEGKTRTITCSKCGWVEHSWVDLNYCPNCGARMTSYKGDGEE